MLYTERQRSAYLAVLFLVATSNYLDRNILAVLLEPIKQEFAVSDTLLGLLSGLCFALCYALCGMPVARWADRGNRRTIITLALLVWSAMTVLCGLVHSFWQLALARVGVGVGESGAIPPAQALLADYFPPARRTTALAIFTAASTAGYVVGFGAGGYIAATRGWRVALILAGALGLLLAVLARFGLAEPRLQLGFPARCAGVEFVPEALSRLAAKRSFLYALAGCIVHFFAVYGALIFVSSFLVRLLHVPLATVSVAYASVTAVGSLIGTLGGGWLADRLASRDIRWLAWLPAATCALAGPAFWVALSIDDLAPFLAFSFVAWMLLSASLPPVFAAIHAVCGSRRRATAVAVALFSATVFGTGFGPLVTGAISDALTALYGAEGLRYALKFTVSLLVVAGALFYLFGRAMPMDLED